jgi:2-oxoacid:acceptor oxidoreductase gamma subunit (pyruvate/2-ketoisovalerate family)/2-oxoacid:acceptor oxidoreductase delta subunit (pyruvate/2-ketoisovalerate family)
MYEIIFHGRGGQGALLAARILANAFSFDGKHVEAFPHFGAERRGAPVRAFLRVADQPIRLKTPILSADCVLIMDASLLDFVDITSGLKEGGLILLNTPLKPEEIELPARYRIATCNASEIALEAIGKDIPNSAMLGAFYYAVPLSKEALYKGFKEIFSNREAAQKNMEMAETAANTTHLDLSSVSAKTKEKQALKRPQVGIGGTFKANGSSRHNLTSSWTIYEAIVDPGKCNFCLLCYTLCPEGCIMRNEKEINIDKDYCKGCGICEKVCPLKAIRRQRKIK